MNAISAGVLTKIITTCGYKFSQPGEVIFNFKACRVPLYTFIRLLYFERHVYKNGKYIEICLYFDLENLYFLFLENTCCTRLRSCLNVLILNLNLCVKYDQKTLFFFKIVFFY